MSLWDRFWNPERVREAQLEEKKTPTAKIVKTDFTRERPEQVTFEKLIRYHDMTPQIQVAVSSYAELITGTDIVFNTEDQEAKDFLEEWNRQNNFYDKFEGLVSTILITGNGLLEKLSGNDITDVEEVDMSTIVSKKRNEVGELEFYEQRQQSGKVVPLHNINDFIEFNLTHYSKQAWGRSLFYSLAVPRTTGFRTTAPLVEIMWGVEDAMAYRVGIVYQAPLFSLGVSHNLYTCYWAVFQRTLSLALSFGHVYRLVCIFSISQPLSLDSHHLHQDK